MAGIVYDLVEVLTQQKECYEGLNVLATYKSEAVSHKEIELLTEIVEKEEAFIGRLTLLEKKREGLLKDISLVTGLSFKTITITGIVQKIGEEQQVSEQLMTLKKELETLIGSLKKQNEINKMILEQSLELVDFSVNALQSIHQNSLQANYGKPGEMNHTEHTSVFDKKQ